MRVDEMKNIFKAANANARGMLEKFEEKCKKFKVNVNAQLF